MTLHGAVAWAGMVYAHAKLLLLITPLCDRLLSRSLDPPATSLQYFLSRLYTNAMTLDFDFCSMVSWCVRMQRCGVRHLRQIGPRKGDHFIHLYKVSFKSLHMRATLSVCQRQLFCNAGCTRALGW